jgi:hypothetical protein
MDPNSLTENIIPKEQSQILFALSFGIAITAMYALVKKQYDIAVICFAGFLTSINFWNDPKYGFARSLDILVITGGFTYLCWRAVTQNVTSYAFWLCFFMFILLYLIGHHLYDQGYIWLSTLTHCGVHLFGNGTFVLFCSIA